MQRFREDYQRKCPVITESTVDIFHAFFTKWQLTVTLVAAIVVNDTDLHVQ